jgi:hypothetical protein
MAEPRSDAGIRKGFASAPVMPVFSSAEKGRGRRRLARARALTPGAQKSAGK